MIGLPIAIALGALFVINYPTFIPFLLTPRRSKTSPTLLHFENHPPRDGFIVQRGKLA